MPTERDGPREGDLDGRERQRDEERGGGSRDVEARRLRDEDEEYTTRTTRQGRTKKKVRKANATKKERDGGGAVPIRGGFEKRRLRRRGGWTRGARTHRLKNLDLYLDLRKERVVRHVEGGGRGGVEGGRMGEKAWRARASLP